MELHFQENYFQQELQNEYCHDDSQIFDNLAAMNWKEISMLLSEVDKQTMSGTEYSAGTPAQPLQEAETGGVKRELSIDRSQPFNREPFVEDFFGTELSSLSGEELRAIPVNPSVVDSETLEIFDPQSQQKPLQPQLQVQIPKKRKNQGQRKTNKKNGDPAPPGSLTFAQVEVILEEASRGFFNEDILKRYDVSPINPDGPNQFYVVGRLEGLKIGKLYKEKHLHKTKAVRLRSTKRYYWFPEDNSKGLQYRQLAVKERKTGKLLEFGGCVYSLVRKVGDEITQVGEPIKFLQIWQPVNPVESSPVSTATAQFEFNTDGSTGDKKAELDPVRDDLLIDIFRRYCEALQPMQFKMWRDKYAGLINSPKFIQALRLYTTRKDPRLSPEFLAPDEMLPGVPHGVFKAWINDEIFSNGGTCFYVDDLFKEMVGCDPTGMKGFFVTIMSPLQRLCGTSVYWRKCGLEGVAAMRDYFLEGWRVSQCVVTLYNGETKILRTNHKLQRVNDDSGFPRLQLLCHVQDVSFHYPEIMALPPFLA